MATSAAVQLWMAASLRRLRTEAGMTQAEAARAAGCSPSYLAILEGGANARTRKRPREPLVTALLNAYGRPDLVQPVLDRVRAAGQHDWWTSVPESALPAWFGPYVGLEQGSDGLDWFEPVIVPGLLQTEDYAREVIDPDPTSGLPAEEVAAQVELRARRQDVITRSTNPVPLWAVLSEQVLDRPIGGPHVMRDQLERLLELGRLPTVTVQIIPRSVGAHRGLRTPFTILRFDAPGNPGLVYIESEVRGTWFESTEDVTQYTEVMNHLRGVAVGAKESEAIIGQHRKEVER